MKNRFEDFLALHKNTKPLFLGNVWNVQSAKAFEQQKFKAIATSSAAVAESLGYADGQEMSIDEYMFIIKRISASSSIPFSVDLEAGYGNTVTEICNNIAELYNIGVSGINIEDSIIADGKRSMENVEHFTKKLQQICRQLNAERIKMFINVRSDSFLLNLPNALDEALSRIRAYQETGVHGLFLPCITKIQDIEKVVKSSKLPVNVMCMPGLPDFEQLQNAGVKRISIGPFLYKKTYGQLEESIGKITDENRFDSLF
ncbi:2-Methylisocitrate lyase, PEP mutase family [Pseudarcicella hirudinis]|uniref:2-Methylisocitrate lyase, PEP mutase family n=1 Tax=Pseudarcicella hirudinis TaxID=1079859 RepID=A0A1I5MAE4_9BACT|nr:isocitrate lyase/phosphoenolpyruvate mutase family protein [Pseudarcicella hirudinis]SFP05991.1 2-Methylisocitrate lyase, PEP mutase family [Pseudarcicella hirudinis]